MKYFHGSRSKFKEFTHKGDGKHGEGYYFTKDKSEATHFATALYGNGVDKTPTVYTVSLKVKNPLNTMDIAHCQKVMEHFGLNFRANKNAGGAKEQYYYLGLQLKRHSIEVSVNEAIAQAGFDAVHWEFMDHMIVFYPEQIEILETEPVDI